MHPMKFLLLVAALGFTIQGSAAYAQSARPGGGADAEQSDADDARQYLGERFTSRAGGISFRPPIQAEEIRPASVGTKIVEYVNAEENWSLQVSRLILEKATPLVGVDDRSTPHINEALTNPGVLVDAARRMALQGVETRILRQDVVNLGRYDVGLIIARSMDAGQNWLRQQALLQANPQLYYVLDFRTPSGWTPEDTEEDHAERLAVEIFRGVLDSVRLIDQRPIIEDYRHRLFLTRSIQLSLPNKVKQVIQSEQYYRILRDGKDIGWSFIAEQMGEHARQQGLLVGIRTCLFTDEERRMEIVAEMFSAADWKGEEWMTETRMEDEKKRIHVGTEWGRTRKQNVTIRDDRFGGREPVIVEQPVLTVVQATKAGALPELSREVPAFYFPQALSHLLPRLVPINQARGYVFLVWISAERELVLRYMDVERERPVILAGRQVSAVRIVDRIGLEGEPTYHYISPAGLYLGSDTPSTNTTIIATDPATLARIWPDAKLDRPKVLGTRSELEGGEGQIPGQQ